MIVAALALGAVALAMGRAETLEIDLLYVRFSQEMTVFCAAMAGATLGFLWFNAPPAQVYMGDTGSLPPGSLLGYVAVVTKQELLLIIIGGVFVILGVAMGLTNYLVDAEVPMRAAAWVRATIDSQIVFLLALNVFLLVVGSLMDMFSAIVVVVPLILPIGAAFGVHPLHLGMIFLINLELGYLPPPVGMNLFLASYRLEKPLFEVARSAVPFLLILFLVVLLVTYVPALTLTLGR